MLSGFDSNNNDEYDPFWFILLMMISMMLSGLILLIMMIMTLSALILVIMMFVL